MLAFRGVEIYHFIDSRQVSDLGYKWVQRLTIASSAPGESSLPLPRNTNGAISDIRQDVVKTRAMVSEVHRDVANMVSDIHRNVLKGQEGTDNRHQPVSVICTLLRYRTNKRSPFPRLKAGQQSQPLTSPVSYSPV